jgi:hypothetical protein
MLEGGAGSAGLTGKRRGVVALNRNWIVDYVLPIALIVFVLASYWLLWGGK